jgi:putative addiction module killer protein
LAFGPGYRVYFGAVDDELILLLSGGNKSSQEKDIIKANEFWADYRRKNHE